MTVKIKFRRRTELLDGMDASITIQPERHVIVRVSARWRCEAVQLTIPQARALSGALHKWDNEGLLDD